MRPETTNTRSIPVERNTVKVLMEGLLLGLPLVTTDYDVSEVSFNITAAEIDTAILRLDTIEKQVGVRAKFKKGAMWNWIHLPGNRPLLNTWLACVRNRIPDEKRRKLYLHNMCGYGKVAAMWPAAQRTDRYSWNYYSTHDKDGKPLSDVVGQKPYFKSVRLIAHAGEIWIECAGHREKLIDVGLSSNVIEAIRVEMGWVEK